MQTENLAPHVPPQGTRTVYRRLWRGYGPLVVVALALILMALLVPTQDTEAPAETDQTANTEAVDS